MNDLVNFGRRKARRTLLDDCGELFLSGGTKLFPIITLLPLAATCDLLAPKNW